MNTPASPDIHVTSLGIEYGSKVVFRDFSASFRGAAFNCVLGRSGSGKSTLLRVIAGVFARSSRASNALFAAKVRASDSLPIAARVAWMGQTPELMPWLNVMDNATFGYRLRGQPPPLLKAQRLLEQVGIGDRMDDAVAKLSGGMKQRLALARTVLEQRDIVLMDEPFSSLDALTRLEMQDLAASVLRGKTVICVTHDPLEALRLGESIQVLSGDPPAVHPIAVPGGASKIPRELGGTDFAARHGEIMQLLQRR